MPEVPLVDAARSLGCSVDKVRRRIRKGELVARKDNAGRLLVDVPGESEVDALAVCQRELAAARQTLADTGTRLAEQEREIAVLCAQIEGVTGERDYLRQAHAASLTLSTRLLPERAESNRSRWQFWRRA